MTMALIDRGEIFISMTPVALRLGFHRGTVGERAQSQTAVEWAKEFCDGSGEKSDEVGKTWCGRRRGITKLIQSPASPVGDDLRTRDSNAASKSPARNLFDRRRHCVDSQSEILYL